MRATFVAAAWRTENGRGRADRMRHMMFGALDEVKRTSWFAIWADPANIATFSANSTVIGTLYDGTSWNDLTDPQERACALVRNSWGSYVAFLSDGDRLYAMADPSGAGRAHVAIDAELSIATDAMTTDVMKAAAIPYSVDLQRLAGSLIDPGSQTSAPLLDTVRALVPGQLHDLRDMTAIRVWRPVFGTKASADDEERLRDVVDRVVRAMVPARPLLELSGGLDSSILASSLGRSGKHADAVNIGTIGGDVDETSYARASAEYCGVQLTSRTVRSYPRYASFMEARQTAHPYIFGVDDAYADIVRSAVSPDTSCIVTGQGGDAVFYQPDTPLTSVDRYRDRGLFGFMEGLLDDGRRTRSSVWELLRQATSKKSGHALIPEDALAVTLLTKDAQQGLRRSRHPWSHHLEDDRPGRALQMVMLANSQIFHSARPTDPGAPLIHPLLAQPVLECALSIPTWRLARGTHNRGLARLAFGRRLPSPVLNRRSKGEAAAFYSRAAAANLPYLRERLLDGALVRSGILDRVALEKVLTSEYLFYSLDYRALILQAACEAWLEAWSR